MVQLLAIRELIKSYVGKYENYVKPIGKFLLTMITLLIIKNKIGYAPKIDNTAILLIVSLLASFMPLNFIPVIAVFFVLLNMYSLSAVAALVVGVVMLIMFLLYFRFTPKDTILLLITPILFVLKIPYVVPLVAGLVAAPTAIVSVGCGAVSYYMLKDIVGISDLIKGHKLAEALEDMKVVIDQIAHDKEMIVIVGAFAVTIVLVSVIRRLEVDHSWTIAIVTGTLIDIVIVLVGDIKFGTYISVAGLIFGSILAVLTVIVIKFFAFNVDYSRTEKVTFEDEEYVYYVKAVPKNTVKLKNKKAHKSQNHTHSKPAASPAEKPHKHQAIREEIPEEITGEFEETDLEMEDISGEEEFVEIKEVSPELRYSPKGDRMTGIEKAAAAKARKAREEKK